MKGILGKKAGMTTVFSEDGSAIPVTVIEVQPNTVLQSKTVDSDGYIATKLGAFDKKDQRATKSELAIAKKANTSTKYFTREIRNMDGYEIGATIDASIFELGEFVDVMGISKGKGFQGAIKRHNFSRGPMAHGSKHHRATGSRGTMSEHVWKGKPTPGHMGHEQVTMQNLIVIDIDLDNNILLVKGSIPGPNKSFVVVKDSIKKETDLESIKLVDVKEMEVKNELLEEAKKVGAEINSKMKISEMKGIIKTAAEFKIANDKEHTKLLEEAKELKISNPDKLSLEDLRDLVAKAKITDFKSEEEKQEEDAIEQITEKVEEFVQEENTKESKEESNNDVKETKEESTK